MFSTVDLSDAAPLGPQVTKLFRRKRIDPLRGLVLKPGQFVLGRTYEAFSIPNDLMGWLTGRSSLGRLGLSVVAPAGLINPGWRGHMPLMLINHSSFDIRLHPYLGIVQLCLAKLSSDCEKPYGEAFGSKYLEDDGGPSRFWRDDSIAKLQENLNLKKTSNEVAELLEAFSQELDEPTRERLSRKIAQTQTIADFDDFVGAFVRSEHRRSITVWVLTLALAALGLAGGWQLGLWHWIALWLIFIACGAAVALTLWRTTIPPEDLRQYGRKVANAQRRGKGA